LFNPPEDAIVQTGDFVGYMLAVQAKVEPTITERLVWKYAWWRCEKIARLAGQSVKEVAA